MPEQLTLTAYHFDELPQEVKTRLLDEYREWDVNAYRWYECAFEQFTSSLPNWYTVTPDSLEFTLGGQGQFASFEAHIDIEAYANSHPQYTRLGKLARAGWLSAGAVPQRTGYAVQVDADWRRRTLRIDRLVNELEADLRADYEARCRALLRDLYTEYEGLTSDDAVSQQLSDFKF